MKILQHIIGTMNKEEVRHLKLFMGRTNSGDDRKDVELFDYIRQHHEDYDESKIQHRLYGPRDKNALYRLKNRLLEDIGKSLALQYLNENDFNEVVHILVLSRFFLSRNQGSVAFHYLQKAEKKATHAESPELMDIVYSEFVRFSQETLEVNPTEYIRKRRSNREQLNRVQEIDDILAEVIFRLRTTQNFSGQDYRIIENLRRKVNEFSKQKSARTSTQLRFKIYHSLSRIFLQKQNFQALEKYLVQTLDEFSKENLFNRNNHDTRLQMLTYLANAQFKNGKSAESLATAARLKTAMNEFGGQLHDKYLFFYYNILVINYADTDRSRAIEILMEAKDNPVIKKLPFYLVFIFLNLTVLNFDNGNYRQAIRNLVKLTMEPGFVNLDYVLRMKIAVAELIIRYELGDFDVLERRLDQVKKEFADLLKKKEGKKQAQLIAIISMMVGSQSVKRDKVLQKKIQRFAGMKTRDDSWENDVINYKSWLAPKMAGQR
ncbi:MAG TPA: hypothetical protein VFU15_13640 [Bacteroidia bacterium]|nr:hypothetical protein [Bacteroidia bacterium]